MKKQFSIFLLLATSGMTVCADNTTNNLPPRSIIGGLATGLTWAFAAKTMFRTDTLTTLLIGGGAVVANHYSQNISRTKEGDYLHALVFYGIPLLGAPLIKGDFSMPPKEVLVRTAGVLGIGYGITSWTKKNNFSRNA